MAKYLYPERRDEKLPSSPEWFAFDAEMSYGRLGSDRNSHLLTYQNVKPVQCLYFDGMSAALMGDGPLDSQMVFLCGITTCSLGSDEPWRCIMNEYARATALCDWVQRNELSGLDWGAEGLVRTDAGFEIIWCNFTSPNIRLVSHVNVTTPLLPESFKQDAFVGDMESAEESLTSRSPTSTSTTGPTSTSDIPTGKPDMPPPPNWRGAGLEPFLRSQSFEWYWSATWHICTSGSSMGRPEGRVKLNLCGFLSYYEPFLADFSSGFAQEEKSRLNLTADGSWKGPSKHGNHSLALKEFSTRRRLQNLSRMTNSEASIMIDAVLHTLHTLNHSASLCTGIDWTQKAVDVTSRLSRPLTQTFHLLTNPPTNTTNSTLIQEYIAAPRAKSHAMLMSYLSYLSPPHPSPPSTRAGKQAKQSPSTSSATPCSQTNVHSWPPSKPSSRPSAIQHCHWPIRSNKPGKRITKPNISTPTPEPVLDTLVSHHSGSVSLLRARLGWFTDDMQCEGVCNVDEFCVLPIWPLLFLEPRGGPGRGPPGEGDGRPLPPHPPGKKRKMARQRRPTPGQTVKKPRHKLWRPRCKKILD
ncbi:hypothetical protein LTR93_011068 [Exophiala xenobiotica]|nr:hypothetical protein LTR93_011068 [Exophiala xenobiotica]